jgi:hypothetical protein
MADKQTILNNLLTSLERLSDHYSKLELNGLNPADRQTVLNDIGTIQTKLEQIIGTQDSLTSSEVEALRQEYQSLIDNFGTGGVVTSYDDTEIKSSINDINTVLNSFDFSSIVDINNFTQENGGYSWWCHPLSLRLKKGSFDDRLIYSIVNKDKETVAIMKNLISKSESRFVLHTNPSIADEHNNASFMTDAFGYIVTAYCMHDRDNIIRIRKSNSKNSIDFGDEIQLTCSDNVTYAQLAYTTYNTISLFYRVGTANWAYRKSTDGGETWTNEVILFNGDSQYYMRFANYNEYLVKFIIVGHPTNSTDHSLRYGRINVGSGLIETTSAGIIGNTDGTDLPASYLDFGILYTPTKARLRLFDIAQTAESTCYAFAEFNDSTDAELYVKKSGNLVKVCDMGLPIDNPVTTNYFCGAWFEFEDDKILYVIRENLGTYYFEKYITIDHSSWTLEKVLKQSTTKINRPISPYFGGDILIYNNAEEYISYQNYYSRVELISKH